MIVLWIISVSLIVVGGGIIIYAIYKPCTEHAWLDEEEGKVCWFCNKRGE